MFSSFCIAGLWLISFRMFFTVEILIPIEKLQNKYISQSNDYIKLRFGLFYNEYEYKCIQMTMQDIRR